MSSGRGGSTCESSSYRSGWLQTADGEGPAQDSEQADGHLMGQWEGCQGWPWEGHPGWPRRDVRAGHRGVSGLAMGELGLPELTPMNQQFPHAHRLGTFGGDSHGQSGWRATFTAHRDKERFQRGG